MKNALLRIAVRLPFGRSLLEPSRTLMRLRSGFSLANGPSARTRLQELRRDVARLLRIEPVFVASDRLGFVDAESRVRAHAQELAQRCSEAVRAHPTGSFDLRRFCLCCNETMPMLVDYHFGAAERDGSRMPNWRERLVCRGCGMNNRQRLVAKLLQQCAVRYQRPRVYLMEQVTPIFRWVSKLDAVDVMGSEYLGYEYRGGECVKGLRHEDVMNLSYQDESFDIIVSNDVLEHIPDPARALRECCRVLKPGGTVLATFPFHPDMDSTRVRARPVGDTIEHLLPPRYHGNPVSADGSLVFQDFGWDFLDVMTAAGFASASCEVYGSDEFGHLGTGLLVFRLSKPPHGVPA